MNRVQSIVSAVVVLVVNLCALLGVAVDADSVTCAVSAVAVIVATAWAFWKNHNFTEAAQQAQRTLEELKGGE